EMNREECRHGHAVAQREEDEAGRTGEQQQPRERRVETALRLIEEHGVVLPLEEQQTRGTDQEAKAAQRSEDHYWMRERIGRGQSESVVIDRPEARGSEAQQEAVEREVMKPAAQSFGWMIEPGAYVAAFAAAFEVLERE